MAKSATQERISMEALTDLVFDWAATKPDERTSMEALTRLAFDWAASKPDSAGYG